MMPNLLSAAVVLAAVAGAQGHSPQPLQQPVFTYKSAIDSDGDAIEYVR